MLEYKVVGKYATVLFYSQTAINWNDTESYITQFRDSATDSSPNFAGNCCFNIQGSQDRILANSNRKCMEE